MSKQIITKNANMAPQVVKTAQKTIIKVAKGQHLTVKDVVQNQVKEAGARHHRQEVAKKQVVQLIGFGTFKAAKRSAHTGKTPVPVKS